MIAIRLLMGFTCFAVVSPSASAQQSVFQARAEAALQKITTPLVGGGFERTGDLRIGVLGERERDSVVVTLDLAWHYVVSAVCDDDCGDLDLHLLDATGKEVAFDVKAGSTPQVQIAPKDAAAYTLVIAMDKCSVEPCYYGVRWVRKAAQ